MLMGLQLNLKDKTTNRSRINSSLHRKRTNDENYNISNIGEHIIDLKRKKTLSKKLTGTSIKFDSSKILKSKSDKRYRRLK